MKILKNILLGIGTILVLLLIVSFFLPSKVHVERTKMIAASPQAIFTHIKDLKTWNTWSPWAKMDSTMTNTYEGAEGEVGQKSIWVSEKVGNGSMEITEIVVNEKLVTKLMFDGNEGGYGTLQLDREGDSTKVTWMLDNDLKNVPLLMKPMTKYFFLFLDKMIGKDFENGLTYLKELAESMPKAEKPAFDIQETTTEEQQVIAAPKKRLPVAEMKPYMDKYFAELFGFALQSNLKPGKIAVIYSYWDGKETEMEAVLPVDKEPADLGGFTYKVLPATAALKVDYYGDYNGLEKVHMAISDFAEGKALKVGNPWEVYVTDPSTQPDTTQWHTQVYYPIVTDSAVVQ